MRTIRRKVSTFAFIALAVFAGAMFASGAAGAQENPSSIGGAISEDGQPVDGVSVDLFTADADGNRLEYLRSTSTGATASGRYEFAVEPGCYAVTAVAPFEQSFAATGAGWITLPVCIEAGESRVDLDAVLSPLGEGKVSGTVWLSPDFEQFDGISVDLFRAGADGSRAEYLRSMVSGAGRQGEFGFDVEFGCYVLTFFSTEDNVRFVESDSGWLNQSFCASSDEDYISIDVFVEVITNSSVRGSVRRGSDPVRAVSVDLFADDGSGGRGSFLASGYTDDSGEIEFGVDAGCYVFTYIGPFGEDWEATGTNWFSQGICVEDGQTATADPALLPTYEDTISIDARVSRDGFLIEGIDFDIFRATPDGGRGEYVASSRTVLFGESHVRVSPAEGCWVMTLIADEADVFEISGTRWLNEGFCTDPEMHSGYLIEADLALRTNLQVPLDLTDGPHEVTAEVTNAIGVDYRVTGTPGTAVALEILDLEECGQIRRAVLQWVIRAADEEIGRREINDCGSVEPWTIPAGGELVLSVRSHRLPVQFEAMISEVDYEDVPLEVAIDQPAVLSGEISTVFEGVDYVITGEPGQAISIERLGSACIDPHSNITVEPLDSADQELSGANGDGERCQPYLMGEIPADGIMKLRVANTGGQLARFLQRHSYEMTVWLFEYEDVIVPSGAQALELSGSVDAPFDGTDYIFDAASFETLTLEVLEPVCGSGGVRLQTEYLEDDRFVRGRQVCGGSSRSITSDASTIRMRIFGQFDPNRRDSTTGPFKVKVQQTLPAVTTCANGDEFELLLRDDFDGDALAEHWTAYNSAGNAGNGIRRPSAVEVRDGKLVITGKMEDGTLVSGGIAHSLGQTYGKYRFRVRTDSTVDRRLTAEVLTWPTSGDALSDGASFIYSTTVFTEERFGFYSVFRKPFGSGNDDAIFAHRENAGDPHIMTMEWTPERITLTRQGIGIDAQSETYVVLDGDENRVSDTEQRLSMQLDAWQESVDFPVSMDVDWVEVLS